MLSNFALQFWNITGRLNNIDQVAVFVAHDKESKTIAVKTLTN